MLVIKKSSRKALAQSKNHLSKTLKHSSKKNNKKHKASRKSKVLYGGAEHINKPSNERRKRMETREKQLLQMETLKQTQAQVQSQQRPVASTSSNLNIMTKLQSVLLRK